MSNYKTDAEKSTDLDDRDAKALTEYMTVLDEGGEMYTVVGQNGGTYTVDGREGRCTCPDFEYRGATCKHIRRQEFATGRRKIPEWVDRDAVDEQLGEHVEGGPEVAATDGGVITDDGAEVLDDEPADPWNGPFDEYDKYGHPTGSSYVRCRDCGVEVVTSTDTETVTHRDGCRFEEGGR